MQSCGPLEDRFDLVIFDCDGVLVDSEIISCSTLAETMSLFGVPCDLPKAMKSYLGRPASAIADDYARLSGSSLPDEFTQKWRGFLFERLLALQPISGARGFIESLQVRYCVASSSDDYRIEFSLRQAGLLDLFDERIFSTTRVRNGKPAPDLFFLAASTMGAQPSRCLVIEDSVSGVTAAKAAGMTACGFTGGSHFSVMDLTDDLRGAGADFVVNSMHRVREAESSFSATRFELRPSDERSLSR